MDYFKKSYPTEPRGRIANHLNTMVLMICGLIGSGRSHLSAIAGQAPSECKVESQIKQFSRWLKNENIDSEVYYLPYLKFILGGLAKKTLVLLDYPVFNLKLYILKNLKDIIVLNLVHSYVFQKGAIEKHL